MWLWSLQQAWSHIACLLCTPSQCPQFSPRGHCGQQLHPVDMPLHSKLVRPSESETLSLHPCPKTSSLPMHSL